jgi:hypothetical protein
MGTWGTDHFANDDAMDWIADLESVLDLSVLRGAFELAPAGATNVEAPNGSVALAAAEVVAALRGRPHPDLPSEVRAWVAGYGAFDDASLVATAQAAVALVGYDEQRSELNQLWAEAGADDQAAWLQAVADLQTRLR